MSKFYGSVERIYLKHVGSMNYMLLLLCLISVALDALFLYVPAIGGNCVVLDTDFGVAVVVLRSVVDCLYMIPVIYRLRAHLSMLCSRACTGRRASSKEDWQVAKGYLLQFLLLHLPAILPLPQILVIWVTTPSIRSNRFLEAMNLLKFFVLLQYGPRSLRLLGLLAAIGSSSGTLAEAALSKAALNLFLYLVGSHVAGALWYFFSIDRAATCWKKACPSYKCTNGYFYCGYRSGNMTFIDEYCLIQTPDTTRFHFGIFLEALQSGIAKQETGILQKLVHCFLWGLQNLSCFGQNLRTSNNFWENVFAVFLVIFGLVLFVSFIGNMQLYLQSHAARTEEMRLKGREIEHWTPYKKLPDDLKEQVQEYQRYKWEATRGVDVENFLNHLPKDLSREIKRQLYGKLLGKVKKIDEMEVTMVDALFDCVKPALYIEGNHIIKEGHAIDQMLFIVQGKLQTDGRSRIAGSSGNSVEIINLQLHIIKVLHYLIMICSTFASAP